MATTDDLRAALAEIDRQEAQLGLGPKPQNGNEGSDDNSAVADRSDHTAAAGKEAADGARGPGVGVVRRARLS